MTRWNRPHEYIYRTKVFILPTVAIRLMLDYAKNVDEAIALLEKYNVNMDLISIHFLLCDAAGNSAVIEFLDGKMQVLRSDKTWQTSTNFHKLPLDNTNS